MNINATVSFTVAQAIASAEAVERGLDRLARSGGDPARLAPVSMIMIGRLDDWLKPSSSATACRSIQAH